MVEFLISGKLFVAFPIIVGLRLILFRFVFILLYKKYIFIFFLVKSLKYLSGLCNFIY